jgi:hypothetical protein
VNDFTKEELAIIHLAIIRDINLFAHILTTSPSMLKLRDKLETMIENYCDHDFRIKKDSDHLYCLKCQKYFSAKGIL